MTNSSARPRVLLVSPEAIFIPNGFKNITHYMVNSSNGTNKELAGFIVDSYENGIDMHVVQPDYRNIFAATCSAKPCNKAKTIPAEQVHLTEDRIFFYSNYTDLNNKWENTKLSIAFQREVLHHIIPRVQPDLIHCHDWMTGLIPAAAKELEIPCLFTMHKPDTTKSLLVIVEDMGIDAAVFWQNLFYDRYPANYEETRETNPANFLLSGILAAPAVTTARFDPLVRRKQNHPPFTELPLRKLLVDKLNTDSALIQNTRFFNLNHYIHTYERMLERPLSDFNMKSCKSRILNYSFYFSIYELCVECSIVARQVETPISSCGRKDIISNGKGFCSLNIINHSFFRHFCIPFLKILVSLYQHGSVFLQCNIPCGK
jgi:hypothetical protein